jgi:hypothetical protein
MRILKCACCGEDVTMPSFKDGKPYGYTCFARLFGKGSKPEVYACRAKLGISAETARAEFKAIGI